MIKGIRLIIYEGLTLIIMTLGWLREKICYPNLILKQRTFLMERSWIEHFGTLEVCCDCGLQHRVFLRRKGLFWQPTRPKGYSYKFRIFRKSSPLYMGEIS